MDRNIKIHLRILAVMVCITAIIYYVSSSPSEAVEEYKDDDYAMLEDYGTQTDDLLSNIGATAIPLVITLLYASYLAYHFAFPWFAEQMSDGVYEPHNLESDDLLANAKKECADGDYTQAIANYRELIKRDHDNSSYHLEIAKIQRKHLDKPRQAIDGLKIALDSRDWPDRQKTDILFYIAEIYEKDFSDHIQAIMILDKIVKQLPNSRYAANAAAKIREFETPEP
ncbi:MAG: tetratricopeptide repeat protein [Verrucomicrobiaceae bacterium]